MMWIQRTRPERSPVTLFVAATIVGFVSGSALGVLWWRLAPRVTIVVRPEGTRPQGFQPEEYLAADVAFAALAFAAGVVLAIALSRLRRHHLLSVLAACLVASALGTAAMWWIGTQLGSVDIEGLVATTEDQQIAEDALTVTMPGVFLMWAIASSIVVLVLAVIDRFTEVPSEDD